MTLKHGGQHAALIEAKESDSDATITEENKLIVSKPNTPAMASITHGKK